MSRKLTPEQKRIRVLERALVDVLDSNERHRCPYCGTNECWVYRAVKALDYPPPEKTA